MLMTKIQGKEIAPSEIKRKKKAFTVAKELELMKHMLHIETIRVCLKPKTFLKCV